jgi:outer membrane protein
MRTIQASLMITGFLIILSGITGNAQNKVWTLEECIKHALDKNISIQKTLLTNDQNQITAKQAQSNRLPSLNGSISQNFNWYKGFDSTTGTYGSSSGSNSSSYSLSSSIYLYEGLKLQNKIKQAELDLQSGRYNSETVKETTSLSVLDAYLAVLYDYESVTNAEKQITSTTEQLNLAKERMDLGVISLSDYLQIKSQLATEKTTLATAKSTLVMGKVTLMQLMELPVDSTFEISSPNLDNLLVDFKQPSALEIYNQALGIKPQIKNVELSKQSAELDIKIAKAEALPTLSMSAGFSTGYSSLTSSDYTSQMKDKVNPSIGFSLSIPISQKRQVKTDIATAKITVANAELTEKSTKNDLRKSIEQACADLTAAKIKYISCIDQKQSAKESYDLATEKYNQNLINAVDYLVQKTSLITAESTLLQAKYNLIFSHKVVDFYKGVPLTL